MPKLYPPYIEGKLPAQIGDTLRIPYQLNRAVGPADLNGEKIHARIKTITTGQQVAALETDFRNNATNDVYYAEFSISGSPLQVGQFYKIQLAFGEGNYYSTVGVFKYTGTPIVSINEMDNSKINSITGSLVGQYSNEDKTEKPYYYKFDIYEEGELIETSDWCVYASDNEPYVISTDLLESKYFAVRYTVRTVNDLVASSPLYQIIGGSILEPNIPSSAIAFSRLLQDDGIVQVGYNFTEQENVMGEFRIHRFDGEAWEVVKELLIDQTCKIGDFILLEDFTVEQGKTYKYAIQQYDSDRNLYTKRVPLGDPIYSTFEDAFLWDGERQLKLRFDPKVSSFKTTMQESKLDTIGGQYPVFFRNGRMAYKEFPINGLISYHMDDNGRFMTASIENESRDQTPSADESQVLHSTSLSNENIALERQFKLEVLNWLNNGKPKLFRSGPEGNYLVRLMNVSLAPNDTLGRMIHSFSSTAYEIADCSLNSLLKHTLAKLDEKLVDETQHTIIEQITQSGMLMLPNAIVARIVNTEPGTTLTFTYKNGDSHSASIGITGFYQIPIIQANPLIKVQGESQYTLEYVYYDTPDSYPLLTNDTYHVWNQSLVAYEEFQTMVRVSSSNTLDQTDQLFHYGSNTDLLEGKFMGEHSDSKDNGHMTYIARDNVGKNKSKLWQLAFQKNQIENNTSFKYRLVYDIAYDKLAGGTAEQLTVSGLGYILGGYKMSGGYKGSVMTTNGSSLEGLVITPTYSTRCTILSNAEYVVNDSNGEVMDITFHISSSTEVKGKYQIKVRNLRAYYHTLQDFCNTIDKVHYLRVQKKDIQIVSGKPEPETCVSTSLYYDGVNYYEYNGQTMKVDTIQDPSTMYTYTLGVETIDLQDAGRREHTSEELTADNFSLTLGPGLYADIAYRTRRVEVEPNV